MHARTLFAGRARSNPVLEGKMAVNARREAHARCSLLPGTGKKMPDLLRTTIEPGLIEQLRLWSVEFADQADEIVRRAVEREENAASV